MIRQRARRAARFFQHARKRCGGSGWLGRGRCSAPLSEKRVLAWFLAAWLSTTAALGDVVGVAYAFTSGSGGGVAVVRVDTRTGRIVDQQTLFQDALCRAPKKLRRSGDGATLAVTNETVHGPHLILSDSQPGGGIERIELTDLPDEIRVSGQQALVSCADDSLALIDLAERTVVGTWSAARELSPPGNAPEDMLFLPGGRRVLVSFQKDSKSGRKRGNRLALLSLPDLRVVADMPLPRNHPELHIAQSKREQGPSPEILLYAPRADALLVTLDLYGAAALLKASQVFAGKLDEPRYLPTSLDGRWGTAFPDRAVLIDADDRPCAIVCNAGPEGGAVLVDLAAGSIVRRWHVPPGLAEPVFLPAQKLAVSVRAGKLKRRTETGLIKERHAGKAIYLFDVASAEAARQTKVVPLRLKVYAVALAAVDRRRSRLILLAAGRDPAANMLLVFDPVAHRFLDRRDAVGTIACFEDE